MFALNAFVSDMFIFNMKKRFAIACIAAMVVPALAQNPPVQPANQPADQIKPAESQKAVEPSVDSGLRNSPLKDIFEAKIKAEWEALKNKDKKSYAELLADDYQGVEVDGKGERTKIQSINELAVTNVFDYTLWGFKFIPLEPDAAFVIYECTMQFPPQAQIRFSRVYITELWVKRDGLWKELHYQETHVK